MIDVIERIIELAMLFLDKIVYGSSICVLNYNYKPTTVPNYIIIVVVIMIIKLTKIDVRHKHLLRMLRKEQQTLLMDRA